MEFKKSDIYKAFENGAVFDEVPQTPPSDDTIRALSIVNELNDRLAEEGITDENIGDLDILFAQSIAESRRRKAPIQRELSLDDTQPMPILTGIFTRRQAE